MVDADQLASLDADQLREVSRQLIGDLSEQQRKSEALKKELLWRGTRIDQLTFELARYRRIHFSRTSEKLDPAQTSLLEEAFDEDVEAINAELDQVRLEPRTGEKQRPRREALPAHLPRIEIRHEPDKTVCSCGCELKRIGEDISEKLAYDPGLFSVERHIRGKWVCAKCETLTQAPVPPEVIDKGIATAGLLAQVMVAKYSDHLPLYRQEAIFGRAGYAIPRSTLGAWVGACGVQLQPLVDALKEAILGCQVLHADETPVAMLAPGAGKTHRAYIWAYSPTLYADVKGVVYDFAENRSGKNAAEFLGAWRGQLVCDDFAGYKALFEQGIVECGCLAHARRKFFDLHEAKKSSIAAEALGYFGNLYAIERCLEGASADERRAIRQQDAKPIADALHAWMLAHRQKVPDGSATAKAFDYSLKRWSALVRYLDDGDLPPDNNYLENQIRPIALGRSNWLFAGSLRAGKRAAAVMSLIQSAKLNGHDPFAYLKDVFTRLPTLPAKRIHELLPHGWRRG